MEQAPVIAGLLEKRAELEASIAEMESDIRKHKAMIVQLDATLSLFAPDLVQARRKVSSFARSAYFVTGELTRRCQTALREARGGTVTADEIAVQAMRDKGLDMGDGELRQGITRRFFWTLNRLMGRGVVLKDGWGAAAKWREP